MMHAYSGRPQQLHAMQLGPNINYSLMLAVYTVAGNASESIVFGKLFLPFKIVTESFCFHILDTQQPKSLSKSAP